MLPTAKFKENSTDIKTKYLDMYMVLSQKEQVNSTCLRSSIGRDNAGVPLSKIAY